MRYTKYVKPLDEYERLCDELEHRTNRIEEISREIIEASNTRSATSRDMLSGLVEMMMPTKVESLMQSTELAETEFLSKASNAQKDIAELNETLPRLQIELSVAKMRWENTKEKMQLYAAICTSQHNKA